MPVSYTHLIYARIAESYGIEILQTQDMEILKPALDAADVVVDALFGTGLSRNIEGFYDVLILYLNLLHKHVDVYKRQVRTMYWSCCRQRTACMCC